MGNDPVNGVDPDGGWVNPTGNRAKINSQFASKYHFDLFMRKKISDEIN